MATVAESIDERAAVLRDLGGEDTAVAAVLAYCENPFRLECAPPPPVFPMADEAHVAVWREYAQGAGGDVLGCLQRHLPQIAIPIREGISKSDAYGAVVRRGEPLRDDLFGGRLTLERPQALQLAVREHAAGALPVILTPHRPDFETLDRALAFRSEPVPINPSVNAHIVGGFVNWDRLARYREEYQRGDWAAEMKRIAGAEKWRFQDRFLLVCASPYSSVDVSELGLPYAPERWLQISTELRLEHEFTHYATKRLYGEARLNILDELICDWAGMTLAMGGFDARCFLAFLGLEDAAAVRATGRLFAYTEELDAASVDLLCRLLPPAAQALEALTRRHYAEDTRTRCLIALTRLTLELLASPAHEQNFERALSEADGLLGAA